jgi:hypothetical protein
MCRSISREKPSKHMWWPGRPQGGRIGVPVASQQAGEAEDLLILSGGINTREPTGIVGGRLAIPSA